MIKGDDLFDLFLMHVFNFYATLTIAFAVCLQVPLLISKLLLLVEILHENEGSLHSYKQSLIMPSSGGKKHNMSDYYFLPVVFFRSPLEVFNLHEVDERYDDKL